MEERKAEEPVLPPSVNKNPFDRETSGFFQVIFPFNKASEDLASSLNKTQGQLSINSPNYFKMLVTEVKKQESIMFDYVSKNSLRL